jgi:hypothetical protein
MLRREKKAPRWLGRIVRVMDGSGIAVPDTAANRAAWPLHGQITPGCGFPVMRVVVLFSLATGAIVAFAKAGLTTSERTLGRLLWGNLRKGDVLLADCGFCGFADFWTLAKRRVDCVMVKHARRKYQRTIKDLGEGDRLVAWKKTSVRPKWMPLKTWRRMPAELIFREVAFKISQKGFRTESITLATTLLDPLAFPAEELAKLYRMRWHAELFLRDIKITLGMDALKCKTPAMIEKEITMYLIAYNLLRALMDEAACQDGANPLKISFAAAMNACRQWAPRIACASVRRRKLMRTELLRALGSARVGSRPDRTEPRARKRRPKNYQLLNKPRDQFREIIHRNKYVEKP